MALIASLSIGAVYGATEGERLDVRTDTRTVADLYNLTVRLSDAIRDQEAGVDDYLLSGSADAVVRYRLADEALYRAKQAGRNRVVYAGADGATDAVRQIVATDVDRPPMDPGATPGRRRARTGVAS